MLAACARKKARHDEWLRCGAGWRPASSSTLRTEVAETVIPKPLSSPTITSVPPVRVLAAKSQDQGMQRRLEWRPTRSAVWIRPAACDQLTVPAQERLGLDREARPGDPRQ